MLGCCHSEVIVSRTRRVLALGGMLFVVSSALAQQEATQNSEGGRQTEASTRAKSEEVRELQHVTTISDSGDFRTKYAEVQLGSLEAGKKYRLHLKALNPSETPIAFSRVELSCTCLKFETPVKEIPAGGSADFVIWIDAPEKQAASRVYSGAKFVDKDTKETVLRLSMQYELSNMFAIKAQQVVLEFPEHETSLAAQVPVLIFKPLTLEQLELEMSENLRDLAIATETTEDGAMINIAATRHNIAKGPISGEVVLRRRGTTDKSSFALVVRQQQSLIVSPESIRLERIANSDSYRSTAMFRMRTTPSEVEAKPLAPHIELWIDGRQAAVEAKPVGKSGIFRLSIKVKGPLELESNGTVPAKWLLRLNGAERVIETHGFLF
jgi:hypothetical protein